jgi:uncharacterized membrane protein
MNWKIEWNVVTLGRVLGVLIIIVGIVLAALDASATGGGLSYGSHDKLRDFFHEAIQFVWYGGLVIALAEVADRMGWGSSAAHGIDWNVTTLLKALGVAIIVVGTIVTAWDVQALQGPPSSIAFSSSPGLVPGLSFSESSRYFVRLAIEYGFDGGLVVLLAGAADRMGWGDPAEAGPIAGETPPEEAPAAVVPEN